MQMPVEGGQRHAGMGYACCSLCLAALHQITNKLIHIAQVSKARLPVAVEAFLSDRGMVYREPQPGLLEARIP